MLKFVDLSDITSSSWKPKRCHFGMKLFHRVNLNDITLEFSDIHLGTLSDTTLVIYKTRSDITLEWYHLEIILYC